MLVLPFLKLLLPQFERLEPNRLGFLDNSLGPLLGLSLGARGIF